MISKSNCEGDPLVVSDDNIGSLLTSWSCKGPVQWGNKMRSNWLPIYIHRSLSLGIIIYRRRQMDIGAILAADESCKLT